VSAKRKDALERIADALEGLALSQARIAAAMEKMEAEPDPVAQAVGDWWSMVQGFYPLAPRRVQ
jgi:hypothetical protein